MLPQRTVVHTCPQLYALKTLSQELRSLQPEVTKPLANSKQVHSLLAVSPRLHRALVPASGHSHGLRSSFWSENRYVFHMLEAIVSAFCYQNPSLASCKKTSGEALP